MKSVATRTVVVVGKRPRISATELLGDVQSGEEAAVLVLGLDPTPAQRRLTESALELAAQRRIVLTAELIPTAGWLRERLRDTDTLRVVAGSREARRWRLERPPA